VPVWLLSAAVATVAVAITWNPMYAVPWTLTPTQIRALAGLFILLVVLIAAGMAPRPSDQRMEATIQHERPQARRTAMRELLARLPAVVLAVAVGWVWLRYGRTGLTWTEASESWGRLLVGALAGGGSAAAAMMLAAGVGWFVRIFFTLVFGKEAYGVGDIYLMAAIAAVGGVWLSVFAFFLGAMLALVGVLAFILRKSSRALPFGPWLSVGALAALWMHDAAVRYVQKGAAEIWWMLKNALRNGV
jgi:prepilin signal peptidase PulO-like enzyme (type II secretory pathway)